MTRFLHSPILNLIAIPISAYVAGELVDNSLPMAGVLMGLCVLNVLIVAVRLGRPA